MNDKTNTDDITDAINHSHDSVSNGDSESLPSPSKAPKALIALASVVGLIVSIAYITMSSDTSGTVDPVFSEEELSELVGSDQVAHAEIVNTTDISLDANTLDGKAISDSDVNEFKTKLSDLEKIVADQATIIDNYKSTIDGVNVRLDQFNETIGSIEIGAINPIEKKISVISKDISKLNALAGDNKRKINKITKKGPGKPPFSLLSIDLWGSKASAVLEFNGKESIASIGDVRAGWKISHIIKSQSCIKAIRVKDSKVAKLCQAGNA